MEGEAIVVIVMGRNWSGFQWQSSGADGHESRIGVVTAVLKLYLDDVKGQS